VTVTCDICDCTYDEDSPNVRWLAIDQVWVCEDEMDCFTRKAPGSAPWIFGTTR
jgi:hypothetical protein